MTPNTFTSVQFDVPANVVNLRKFLRLKSDLYLPAGTYDGVTETMHIALRGQTRSQIARARTNLSRKFLESLGVTFPEASTFISIDVELLAHVLSGEIVMR